MKIYQLYRIGGSYDLAFKKLLGTYLHGNKANKEKDRLTQEYQEFLDKYSRCKDCVLIFPITTTNEALTDEALGMKDKCPHWNLESDSMCVKCKNAKFYDELDNHFEIREVEVNEERE